jgi:hypothetical protein
MKYKIIHLFVKLTNLFLSKIVTTKVNKIIFFFVFYYRCDSHATKDFTRFHWIIHDHVIHELYCHNNKMVQKLPNSGAPFKIFIFEKTI